jgi:transcriptional regulator with XRE-family HTH domain
MEHAGKRKAAKDPEMERVGKTLATIRERFGYTQETFGTALGVSRPYISLIEAGYKKLPNRLLFRAAELLEVTPLAIKRPEREDEAVAA